MSYAGPFGAAYRNELVIDEWMASVKEKAWTHQVRTIYVFFCQDVSHWRQDIIWLFRYEKGLDIHHLIGMFGNIQVTSIQRFYDNIFY